MKGAIIALRFLTRLPMPRVAMSDEDFARSMRWFPVAGVVVGSAVAAAAWTGALLDPWTGALTGLVAWVAITGALHLDGLGDIADAVGAAHRDPARLRAVLVDPHIGSFGVCIVALQLIAKLVLLHALATRALLPAVILAAAVARIGPLVWTLLLPPLHPGLAARFHGHVRWTDAAGWGGIVAGAAIWAPPILIAAVLLPGWALWLRRRIGGLSGDGHGAGIELCETALLAALLVGAGQG